MGTCIAIEKLFDEKTNCQLKMSYIRQTILKKICILGKEICTYDSNKVCDHDCNKDSICWYDLEICDDALRLLDMQEILMRQEECGIACNGILCRKFRNQVCILNV